MGIETLKTTEMKAKPCETCDGTGDYEDIHDCPDCMGSGFAIPDREEDQDETDETPVLKLSGEDGNAFAILGRAARVAKKNNMDWDAIRTEATSGDYDHLLQTMMKYFDVI